MKLEEFKLPDETGKHEVTLCPRITPLVPVHKNADNETILACLTDGESSFNFSIYVVEPGGEMPPVGKSLFLGHLDGRYYFLEQPTMQIAMPGRH